MSAELTGRRLGVYELHERIGAGGMGEVYRGRDTRLQRDVAVKILPEAFAVDGDRRARFEREALLLASLNHPNIATIHGIEDAGGIHALVMELVDGETLAERLAHGALPIANALAIARQIAEALDTAHERGIVHRDLKPSNIKVTSSGLVKILDFGLAKAVAGDLPDLDAPSAATVTAVATHEGLVVGTPGYMSPEQMRGDAVDKRTDIWAFGCVLYEMLTGRAAFARKTMSDTIVAILDRDPEWDAAGASTPAPLRTLVNRCLAKDPRHRLRDIGDARLHLEELISESPAAAPVAAQRGRRFWLSVAAALAIAALSGAALALLANRPPVSSQGPAQFTLSFAGQMPDMTISSVPLPSPDARHLVLVGTNQKRVTSLWIRSVDSGAARSLAGTEGAETPIWSPDGRWIGFYADGKLKKISVDGGQPQTITTLTGFQDASWGSQGDIVFRPSNRTPLFRVSETGGAPSPLTRLNAALGENSHRGPFFLPDGRRFLFTSRCADSKNNALYLGSLDSPGLQRVMTAQSKVVLVTAPDGAPTLIYYSDGGLEARTFDPDRNALGNPRPVTGGVSYQAASILAGFEASADGRMIVVRSDSGSVSQLTWFDRTGQRIGTLGGPGDYLQPRISPRGDRVAFSRPDPRNGNRDVWTIEIDRGVAAPLTRHPANDWHPVWSPDGLQLLFNSDRAGGSEGIVQLKKAINPDAEEVALFDSFSAPTDWSRDGRWIAVAADSPGVTHVEIASASDHKSTRLTDTPFRNGAARFSPDGKWLAEISEETGRWEVFVRLFDGEPKANSVRIQISAAGGDYPVWSPDGQELYFMTEDSTIHAVPARLLQSGGPVPRSQPLFRACPGSLPQNPPMSGSFYATPFDTHDGKRFLINCATPPAREFVVLMNWPLTARK